MRRGRRVSFSMFSVLVGGLLLLAVSSVTVIGCGPSEPALHCYVGGTMRPAMARLSEMYQERTGQRIDIDYAGSGQLFETMKLNERGDLYVAHDPYYQAVMLQEIGVQGWLVAVLEPVIVVQKGNPKGITGFRDLAREDVSLVLPHAVYSTTGWIVSAMAEKAGITEQIKANVSTRQRGGTQAAEQIQLGMADAAVVWNAVHHARSDDLDRVDIEPELREVDSITVATFGECDLQNTRVTVKTLKYSDQLEAATAFAEFLASEEAAKIWEEFGFLPPGGVRLPAVERPNR